MSATQFAHFSNLIGIFGVSLVLIAYFLLNTNKMASTDMGYLALNFIGAWCLLFSLLYNWNLASVLIEIAWILISALGFYRAFKKKNNKK